MRFGLLIQNIGGDFCLSLRFGGGFGLRCLVGARFIFFLGIGFCGRGFRLGLSYGCRGRVNGYGPNPDFMALGGLLGCEIGRSHLGVRNRSAQRDGQAALQ